MSSIELKWKAWGDSNAFVAFLDALLKGFSQLVLNESPICGALIICATAYASPLQTISAVWAACIALLITYALGVPQGPVRDGLYTINPTLAGMALPMVVYKNNFAALPEILVYATVAAVLTVLFTAALRRILGAFQVSPLALPYCITIMLISSSAYYLTAMNVNPLFHPAVVALQTNSGAGWNVDDFVTAVLNGIAEVVWIEDVPRSTTAAIIILVGVCLASRIAALIMVVFAVSATGMAILLGVGHVPIMIGLYGYNAVLIGLVIFGRAYKMSLASFLMAFMLAIVSVVFVAGLKPLFGVIGAPVAVFPFVFTAISAMLGRKFFTKLTYIAPENWRVPELSRNAPAAESPNI